MRFITSRLALPGAGETNTFHFLASLRETLNECLVSRKDAKVREDAKPLNQLALVRAEI